MTISRPLINRYKANLQAYCQELQDYCTRRGITYLFTSTRVPFDKLVMAYLRQRGLLRRAGIFQLLFFTTETQRHRGEKREERRVFQRTPAAQQNYPLFSL